MNPYNTKTYVKYKILSAPQSVKKVIQSSYNTQDKRTFQNFCVYRQVKLENFKLTDRSVSAVSQFNLVRSKVRRGSKSRLKLRNKFEAFYLQVNK